LPLQAIVIGAPGAGKTTIGRALAAKLAVDFRDTDSLIESETGEKISQLFVDKGEPWFRELEARVLERELSSAEGVLALGGGAPLPVEAQRLLKSQSAPIIFLDVSLSTAAPRVGFNRDRPLLLSNPRAAWQELMDKRRPQYESLATLTVVVDDKSPTQIVEEIIGLLS
jgi:shikimate kinase